MPSATESLLADARQDKAKQSSGHVEEGSVDV